MCECTREPFHYSDTGFASPLIPHKDEVHIHGLKEYNHWDKALDNLYLFSYTIYLAKE